MLSRFWNLRLSRADTNNLTWRSRPEKDGVFVFALFDLGFLSAKEVHKVLKAGLEARLFEAIALYPGEVRVCVCPVCLSGPDEYYSTCLLYRTGRAAKITEDNGTIAEYQTEVRQQVLG